ncbi:MAG: bifunctional DNA-binding transcriptional regulator/O6-methylguanine-DNA methyltransferase Ada [Chloroflexi bacterium]|nr:bifunctional DNA-binding transcriptional regulator/O6-methylguanine-DNA methyltransferase Ada [Chloroflexota bacterium]MDA1271379.1 bifunctional DNA-binding transcriptional regulator/O6-methylguanine-DNA methyltransferase Ada [Chloroflexota bacterium]
MVAAEYRNSGIDPDKWEAVQTRDARADGRFVYSVSSTGIYCRPTCPSRRPAPHRVAFFPRAVDAEAAGFRACKRCLPDQESASVGNAGLVRRVCKYIQDNSDSGPTLAEIGRAVGTSPSHVQRVFKDATGVTPHQYASAWRMDRFKAMIKGGQSISAALYEAGFGSPSRLYERSEAHMGMSPGVYRNGGKGMNIYHTVAACPMGRLLVASTDKGVCSVMLGDSDTALKERLLAEFPSAKHQQDGGNLAIWTAEILSYLDGEKTGLDLPLDIQATAFQQQVWQMLKAIPYGETRTYRQVAQSLGNANSSRAVGTACGANPVALVIPCHRVLRTDGGLGGYEWGLERKKSLLAMEQAAE